MQDQSSPFRELRQIYDELRLKMHLGQMEARQWWTASETQMAHLVDSLSRQADKAAASASVLVTELAEEMRRVRNRIHKRD